MNIKFIVEKALCYIATTKNNKTLSDDDYLAITQINRALNEYYQTLKNGSSISASLEDILNKLKKALQLKDLSPSQIDGIMNSFGLKQERYLLCFPHAGGSANCYHRWVDEVKEKLTMVPIELPGHGSLFHLGYPENLSKMLQFLLKTTIPFMHTEFSLFGHSFGAFLAYELTLLLQKEDHSLPKNLILSASASPNKIPLIGKYMNNLKDEDLWKLLINLDGMNHILQKAEEGFRQFYLTLLRKDLQLMENYRMIETNKIKVPVCLYVYNQDEELINASIDEWRDCCDGLFRVQYFEGGHFNLLRSSAWLNDIIRFL